MARIAAHIVIAAPAELCLQAAQALLSDEQLRGAARQLRPGKEYSGYVTAVKPGRWLEIAFAALDPLTGRRFHSLGWQVTYDFLPLDDSWTRVEVAVEYGIFAALGAMGLLRAQAENEVAHRLMAMHAVAFGLHRGAVPQLDAARRPNGAAELRAPGWYDADAADRAAAWAPGSGGDRTSPR